MSRRLWNKTVVHMADKELLDKGVCDSICWIKSRRHLNVTLDVGRVSCKFCRKLLEDEDGKSEN